MVCTTLSAFEERDVTEINKADTGEEVELLMSTEKEWDELPSAIQYLQQGGLVISPQMLPFLRSVVEKTTSLPNDERSRQHGTDMMG